MSDGSLNLPKNVVYLSPRDRCTAFYSIAFSVLPTFIKVQRQRERCIFSSNRESKVLDMLKKIFFQLIRKNERIQCFQHSSDVVYPWLTYFFVISNIKTPVTRATVHELGQYMVDCLIDFGVHVQELECSRFRILLLCKHIQEIRGMQKVFILRDVHELECSRIRGMTVYKIVIF